MCGDFSHSITDDGGKVGGMIHVDVLSVAPIEQGGVLNVKMETQQLILKGESQCFHCEEKKLKEKQTRMTLYCGCGNTRMLTHTHTIALSSEDLWGGKTAGVHRSRGVTVFL